MTTSWCDELDGQAAADAVVANHAVLVAAEAREVVAAVHWADLHAPEVAGTDGAGRVLPGTERPRAYGGDGTPEVGEFAAHELAVLLGVGVGTAEHLLRDGLDLRHRHPQLWQRVVDASQADAPGADPALAVGLPRVWQARQVAAACHRAGLTREQARWVDAQTTPRLGRCNWGRFTTELAASIIDADPKAAKEREDAERLRRYVTTGQSNEHGLTVLVAKVEAGDAIAFKAVCDLIAGYLKADGDTSTADVRRSKAVGLLANPAAAVGFLVAHGYAIATGSGRRDGEPTGCGPEDDTGAAGPSAAGPAGAEGGQLDLFGDRRIHGREPTQSPNGAPEDVPLDTIVGTNRNAGWHDREPEPEEGDRDPSDQDGATPGGPPRSREPVPEEALRQGPPPDAGLRPGDLHPASDDSDDAPCPICGSSPASGWPSSNGPGEESALNRLGRALALLQASGVLEKITAIDPVKLLPKATMYVHFDATRFRRDAEGVVRFEGGIGPLTAATAIDVLGHSRVAVKPVIDLAGQVPADAYEVPRRLREALHLAMPGSVFPYASYTGQTAEQQDADHTAPYVPMSAGGPPGQTALDNLGFLGRSSHRLKTFGRGWRHHQSRLGVHLWRTRHGYWYRVDHLGTHPLGKHPDLAAQGMSDSHGQGEPPASPLEQHLARLIAQHHD